MENPKKLTTDGLLSDELRSISRATDDIADMVSVHQPEDIHAALGEVEIALVQVIKRLEK